MGGLLRGQLEIVGVTVHLGTQVLIARQHWPAQLARTANRAKTEVRQRELVRWQTVDAVVRQGTLGPIVRPHPSALPVQMGTLV